ncbi:hypothetical protein, partial [Bacillus amyloliquefaciens]|uniref:hypothetical protein n=1 Tax=Bacillus amyloliquefaciens TaxID=1390 RepID=UPI00197ACB1E
DGFVGRVMKARGERHHNALICAPGWRLRLRALRVASFPERRAVMTSGLDWQLHPLTPAQGLGPHREAWDRLNTQLMSGHGMLDGAFVDA